MHPFFEFKNFIPFLEFKNHIPILEYLKFLRGIPWNADATDDMEFHGMSCHPNFENPVSKSCRGIKNSMPFETLLWSQFLYPSKLDLTSSSIRSGIARAFDWIYGYGFWSTIRCRIRKKISQSVRSTVISIWKNGGELLRPVSWHHYLTYKFRELLC